jgi:ATP-binding cassette subfamily B protein
MAHPMVVPVRQRRPLSDEERPRTWRERLAALRYLPKLLKLVWATHRGFTTAMIALRLLRAFVPVASLWAAKLIIDEVVALTQSSGGSLSDLWRVVALELLIVVVGEILARASSLVESLLGDLFSNHISVRLMRHAATLDLAQFEDPQFYDHLERARRQTTGRIGLIAMLLSMGQDLLTLLSLGAALVVYNPWLLVLLAVAIVPSFLGETHFASLSYSLLFRWTPERRELDYLRYVGASDKTAKEVQMFGLAGWLSDRYAALAQRYYDENKRLSVRKGVVSALLSVLGTLLLRRLRDDPAARRLRLDLARHPDLPGRGVRTQPRSHSTATTLGERHLRAEPVPEGPVRLLRDAAHDQLAAGRTEGA